MNATPLWPLFVYLLVVIALVSGLLLVSHFLGSRHHGRAMGEPFESGIAPTASARFRFSAQFYVVAVLFVMFDLEAVFIYAWAIAAREAGWAGYVEILVFISILLVALGYLWRVGALDWAPGNRARRHAR